MEPRSFERGKHRSQPNQDHRSRASMEPRSFERGKIPFGDQPDDIHVLLQWSRVRLNAESRIESYLFENAPRFNGAAFV